jgi:hypothetical protein
MANIFMNLKYQNPVVSEDYRLQVGDRADELIATSELIVVGRQPS